MRLKDQARKRHRSYLEQLGIFDVPKIIEDDRKEILRLSVWSWQQFMSSLDHSRVLHPFGNGVTHVGNTKSGENEEQGITGVNPHGTPVENSGLLPVVPEPRDRELLPVMGIEIISGDGDDDEEEERVVTTPSHSLLQCNTCAIRDNCPKAKANAACAYEIPIVVTSKNQMRRLQDAVIEAQYQRTARMLMFEQVNGGYADGNTSAELDRLQKMINAKRDAEKSGFSLHMDVHDDAGTGVMSRVFGRDVGDAVTALPEAIDSQQIMDAEIVETDRE
jgi:hypothetical protein